MKPIIYLCLHLLLSASLYSQNADSIRILKLKDTFESFSYKDLALKYQDLKQKNDTTELEYLYYLKCEDPDYSYFDLSDDEKEFGLRYSLYDYNVAKTIGLRILKKDPTEIKTLLHTAICLQKNKQADSAKVMMNRLNTLVAIITKYGDGKSEAASFKLNKIADEYAFLELSGDFKSLRKTHQNEYCTFDVWEMFSSKKVEKYKLYFSFNKLYTIRNKAK